MEIGQAANDPSRDTNSDQNNLHVTPPPPHSRTDSLAEVGNELLPGRAAAPPPNDFLSAMGPTADEAVHDALRNAPRRRGCAGLETLCLFGCFSLIGILILMHIYFVGDPPEKDRCLPAQDIRDARPELIEIRIVGSFSRLTSRLRAELSLAIQKRTAVVTLLMNNKGTRPSSKAAEDVVISADSGHTIPQHSVSAESGDVDEMTHLNQQTQPSGAPFVSLVKRTVGEPWKRMVATVRRVRSSITTGPVNAESAIPTAVVPDESVLREVDTGASKTHDSFFYLPFRMTSTFTASKVCLPYA
jgi:hypothetical protein